MEGLPVIHPGWFWLDHCVAAPAENSSQHEEAETFGPLESNGRWH
jgi:hypothetical protein